MMRARFTKGRNNGLGDSAAEGVPAGTTDRLTSQRSWRAWTHRARNNCGIFSTKPRLRRAIRPRKNLAPGIGRCVWSELPSTSCDPQSPLLTRVRPRFLHAKIACALQPAPVRL